MKKIKILLILIFFSFILLPSNFVSANRNVNIYFFWGDGCPHCEKELKLLNFLENKYSQVKVYDYEVYKNKQNFILLQKVASELNYKVDGVPFAVIGGKKFSGFSDSVTSQQIEDQIDFCLKNQCPDTIEEILQKNNANDATNQNLLKTKEESKINYKNIILIICFIFLLLCTVVYLFFTQR